MKFLKNNIIGILILIVVILLLLDRWRKPQTIDEPVTKRDTVWIEKDTIIYSTPQFTESISSNDTTIIQNNYIPDTNYSKLVAQYYEVVNKLLAMNIFHDTIRIDTNGYVKIIDTVQNNMLVGRSTLLNIKYPTITETVMMPERKTSQIYLGGILQTNLNYHQIGVGGILKTKNDFMIGGSFGINTYGDAMYGVNAYWKLKFK